MPQPVRLPYRPAFRGHLIFALIVMLMCNPLFGLIAVVLAGSLNCLHKLSKSLILSSLLLSLLFVAEMIMKNRSLVQEI